MSADAPDDQTNSPLMPDMRALDAALREVLAAGPQSSHDAPQIEDADGDDDSEDKTLALDQTMDVVTRAASTIDELIERNRSITNAAVRSVEFFRAQAGEYRSEAERLREELRQLKEQGDAQQVAALAQSQELETELAARTAELEEARAWIEGFRSQVDDLLGDAQTRLEATTDETLFG